MCALPLLQLKVKLKTRVPDFLYCIHYYYPGLFVLYSFVWTETLLVTAAVLVDAANAYDTGSFHVHFDIVFVQCRPNAQIS